MVGSAVLALLLAIVYIRTIRLKRGNPMHDSSGKLDLTTASTARERLHSLANPCNAIQLQKYFKTGPGDYGQGDDAQGGWMDVA